MGNKQQHVSPILNNSTADTIILFFSQCHLSRQQHAVHTPAPLGPLRGLLPLMWQAHYSSRWWRMTGEFVLITTFYTNWRTHLSHIHTTMLCSSYVLISSLLEHQFIYLLWMYIYSTVQTVVICQITQQNNASHISTLFPACTAHDIESARFDCLNSPCLFPGFIH